MGVREKNITLLLAKWTHLYWNAPNLKDRVMVYSVSTYQIPFGIENKFNFQTVKITYWLAYWLHIARNVDLSNKAARDRDGRKEKKIVFIAHPLIWDNTVYIGYTGGYCSYFNGRTYLNRDRCTKMEHCVSNFNSQTGDCPGPGNQCEPGWM